MKINNNRDCETMKAENLYTADYKASSYDNYCDACSMNMYMPNMMGESLPGVVCPPIYECPRETVCHRYICHEVPQD